LGKNFFTDEAIEKTDKNLSCTDEAIEKTEKSFPAPIKR
jgi:hypothetical protein